MCYNSPLGLARELVEEDGDSVDGTAALEVRLDLLWGGRVVDIADKDAAAVDVIPALGAKLLALRVEARLHFPKLGGLLFHLGHPLLHRRDLLLRASCISPARLWKCFQTYFLFLFCVFLFCFLSFFSRAGKLLVYLVVAIVAGTRIILVLLSRHRLFLLLDVCHGGLGVGGCNYSKERARNAGMRKV